MTSSDKAQELLQKYSLEALGESLLAYVTKARAALGPPLLKVSVGCKVIPLHSVAASKFRSYDNESPFFEIDMMISAGVGKRCSHRAVYALYDWYG